MLTLGDQFLYRVSKTAMQQRFRCCFSYKSELLVMDNLELTLNTQAPSNLADRKLNLGTAKEKVLLLLFIFLKNK